MKFDSKYSGRVYSLVNGQIYNWNAYGRMAAASVFTGYTADVTLTGYTTQTQSGTTMYQTTSGGYIDLADGWRESGTGSVPRISMSEAEKQVNTIIKNNKTILEHNLLCARFADRLTKQEQATLYALQQRLEARNQRLIDDGLLTNIKTAGSKDFGYFNSDLQAFMDDYKSGAIGSVTLTIVVTAVILASLTTAVYFAYKYFAAESEKDVKYSDELTKTLMAKLTPEEYQQLLDETQGIVTKARISQTFSSVWKTSKFWIVGTLAFIGGTILYKTIKKQMR